MDVDRVRNEDEVASGQRPDYDELLIETGRAISEIPGASDQSGDKIFNFKAGDVNAISERIRKKIAETPDCEKEDLEALLFLIETDRDTARLDAGGSYDDVKTREGRTLRMLETAIEDHFLFLRGGNIRGGEIREIQGKVHAAEKRRLETDIRNKGNYSSVDEELHPGDKKELAKSDKAWLVAEKYKAQMALKEGKAGDFIKDLYGRTEVKKPEA